MLAEAETIPALLFPPLVPSALALPAELTLYFVDELMPKWLALIDEPGLPPVVAFDASAVREADAAGLQLLVSLGLALQRRDRMLRLEAPSVVLCDTCQRLGLTPWLAEVTAGGAGR